MDSPKLRLEWLDPADLKANDLNWRQHPAAQMDALKDAIEEVGWAGALLYNEKTQRLIDGHARKELFEGKGKVPVLVGSWDEGQERQILATLDPIAAMAQADAAKLDALLREVQTGSEAIGNMLTDLAEKAKVIPATYDPPPNGDDIAAEEEWQDEEEDALDTLFKAPFPWFGGKARVARKVWPRFGNVPNYIEPFFGSGAMLLNRPLPVEGVTETVNDFDGLVCNFWRAVQAAPDDVARYADWPINENDLHARHSWLIGQKETLQARLEGDPNHFDAKTAGWWCWGMACWIGSGFCRGDGPWKVVDGQLVHLGNEGRGVNRQLVHLSNEGQGVNRKRVHLSNEGRGVNRKLVHLGDEGRGKPGLGECGLYAWMQALAERLRRVRVCCGDWTRVCGGRSGDALQHFFAGGNLCGIFLDPPYADTAGRDENIYRVDSSSVAHAVREWAIAHGDDPRLRIALCGYEGEHQMPASWECVKWKSQGGMAQTGHAADSPGKVNRLRERIWFSPHCLKP